MKDRRALRFGRMSDILADAEALAASGDIRAAGNWSPGQVVHHVTAMIRNSIDGFDPPKASLAFRLVGSMLRSRSLNRGFPAGLKVPKTFRSIIPPPDVPFDDALAELRVVVGRIENGERMTQPSPVLGDLVHEEWIQLHCRHAELHFSFLHPGAGDPSA